MASKEELFAQLGSTLAPQDKKSQLFSQLGQTLQPKEPSALDKFKSFFTGELRKTPEMENMRSLSDSGAIRDLMRGADLSEKDLALMSVASITSFNPKEVIDIAKGMNPNLQVRYNKDAQGEVYPMLTNPETGEDFIINKAGMDIGDLGRFAGIGAIFSPAGLATNLGKKTTAKAAIGAATGAATQAALEGGQAALGGDFDLKEIGLAGATGGASEYLAPLAGGAYRYTKQLLRGSGDLDAMTLVRQAEQANVPLMTSDVFQPETAMGKTYQTISERIPILGTASNRAAQAKARLDSVENLMADFAADVGEDYLPYLVKSMKQSSADKRAKISLMNNRAIEALDSAGTVQPTKAVAMIQESIQKELSKQRPNQKVVDDLSLWLEQLQPSNFKTIKESRSTIQKQISEMYSGQNTQIGKTEAPLYTKIVSALDEDLTDFARSTGLKDAYRDWRVSNTLFREEYQKMRSGAIKQILDKGDIEPEKIRLLLSENKPSANLRLWNNLTPEGRQNTQKLILTDAYNRATSNSTGELSADAFATALSRKDPLVKVFFKGDDGLAVEGLINVLRNTQRANQAGTITQTGQQAGALLGVGGTWYGMALNPAATASLIGVIGAATKGGESKAARNILIKLAGLPPQSEKYKNLVDQLTKLTNTMAQPTINAGEDNRQEMIYGSY